MRRRLWLLLLLAVVSAECGFGGDSALDKPATVEENEIVRVIEQLFRGIRLRDTTMLAEIVDSAAAFLSVRDVGGSHSVRRTSASDFLVGIASGEGTLVERMWNPEVRIDGDVATLWAPYDFHIDDQLSHCGYDAFHLVRLGGKWRIAAITYTVRDNGCGGAP